MTMVLAFSPIGSKTTTGILDWMARPISTSICRITRARNSKDELTMYF